MQNLLKSNVFNKCEHNANIMNEIRDMSKNTNVSINAFLSIRDKLLKSLITVNDIEKYILEESSNGAF